MALSTKNIGDNKPRLSKREKILALMKDHQPLFDKEGISNPKFIPRLCYKQKGEMIIGFYNMEITGGNDIYIEFCDRSFLPEDDKRTLYKWIFNPEYTTEYAKSDPHPATGDRRYLIPVAELINVTELHNTPTPEVEEKDEFEELTDGVSDVPYDAMTLRDYAAIQWKKPVSCKKWLNELVTKTFKE